MTNLLKQECAWQPKRARSLAKQRVLKQVKKFLEESAIVINEAIIPDVWKMVFHAPQIAAAAKPGQFVNVQKTEGKTFLRRPFGIVDADTKAGTVTIIYRLVGKGTHAELMRNCEVYKEIALSQLSEEELGRGCE